MSARGDRFVPLGPDHEPGAYARFARWFDTAWGIRRLALEGMARAVRSRLIARGLDPRNRTLLSFGGCGGLFTSELARLIGAPGVIVPQLASVWSAYGAATTDIRRERSRTLAVTLP